MLLLIAVFYKWAKSISSEVIGLQVAFARKMCQILHYITFLTKIDVLWIEGLNWFVQNKNVCYVDELAMSH